MKTIDLHTHTTASDGTYTPEELVDYALIKKLSAIAITDHDTVYGISKARSHINSNSLEVISGIEFSTTANGFLSDIHIVGLFIDENDAGFLAELNDIINSRNNRNKKMIKRLNELGVNITLEDVIKTSTDGVITRAHFGKALLNKGYISKFNEAFSKYIGNGCPAYVPREKLTTKKAIGLVRSCGGVAILAHPTLYHLDLRELEKLIKSLVDEGLQGIEVLYSLHTQSEVHYLQDFANHYNLVISGGSDFHGGNKQDIDLGVGRGNLTVPYSILEPIRKLSGNK